MYEDESLVLSIQFFYKLQKAYDVVSSKSFENWDVKQNSYLAKNK